MRPLTRGPAIVGSLVGVAIVIGLGFGAPALGAPCGRPDLVDMVPPDKATDVPANATLAAHYASSADYLGEDVILVTPDGEQTLPATFDATEGRLSITPPDPLVAGAAYTVRWPALRGLNAAAPGTGGQAAFSVGAATDDAPPEFGGVVGATWDLLRQTNDCTDSIEERFIFDLDLGPATDDGGRDGLTLILFQTSAPGASDASVPVLARALPPEGERARVALPTGDAVGRICFAGLVRDTTGKVSNSANREACVDTTAPPFFRGCALAAAGRPDAAGVALGLLLLFGARARRGRPRP